MATKISALPTTTTPASTATIPLVESSTTQKATIEDIIHTRLGWFSVAEGGTAQTGLGTTEVQLTVDAALTGQGGYGYLPHSVVSPSSVYDAASSKILLGWLDEGQAIAIGIEGSVTTDKNATSGVVTLKFYDSSDVLQFTRTALAFYVHTASSDNLFMVSFSPIWISSELAASGYCQAFIKFGDTNASGNAVDMGSFTVSVLK